MNTHCAHELGELLDRTFPYGSTSFCCGIMAVPYLMLLAFQLLGFHRPRVLPG